MNETLLDYTKRGRKAIFGGLMWIRGDGGTELSEAKGGKKPKAELLTLDTPSRG